VQSAQRGDVNAQQALTEISTTVERATELANQLLALAKVEQLRHQGNDAPVVDWAATVRAVALDVSPLIADAQLEFDIHTIPARVRAHEWALRELTRNLLHNAVRHSPLQGKLRVQVAVDANSAVLSVADDGPGIPPGLRPRLFEAFASHGNHGGSGLGLAICHGIVQTLDGEIRLENRLDHLPAPAHDTAADAPPRVLGLTATVRLPLDNRA
jgi:two-component system sensor histidine kinase TctE